MAEMRRWWSPRTGPHGARLAGRLDHWNEEPHAGPEGRHPRDEPGAAARSLSRAAGRCGPPPARAASARLGPIMAMLTGAATAVRLLVLLLTTALSRVLGAGERL